MAAPDIPFAALSLAALSLAALSLAALSFAVLSLDITRHARHAISTHSPSHFTPQNLYGVLTLIALGMITPFALLAEGKHLISGTAATIESVGLGAFLRMLLYAGMSHYLYNECAFLALSSVHPVRDD